MAQQKHLYPARWKVPEEWAEYGARWGNDGLLYLGPWRRGFTVHELGAMFCQCQQVRSLTHDVARLAADLTRLEQENAALVLKAAFYRKQCQIESKLGLALSVLR
jgi:hypothetical protein